MSDEYELVFEHRGIDIRLFTVLDLLLGTQQMPDFVRGEGPLAVQNARALIIDQGGEEFAVPPLGVGVGDRISNERHPALADYDLAPLKRHLFRPNTETEQRGGNPERRHEAIAV